MFLRTKEPVDQAVHRAKYGDSSHLPPNFKEITAAEFAASKFFIYSPDFWEYRQINGHNDPEGAKKFTGDIDPTRHLIYKRPGACPGASAR